MWLFLKALFLKSGEGLYLNISSSLSGVMYLLRSRMKVDLYVGHPPDTIVSLCCHHALADSFIGPSACAMLAHIRALYEQHVYWPCHVCVCARARVGVCVFVFACVRACVCVCVRACGTHRGKEAESGPFQNTACFMTNAQTYTHAPHADPQTTETISEMLRFCSRT